MGGAPELELPSSSVGIHLPECQEDSLEGDSNLRIRRILILFLATNIWTLVMTAFPVLFTLPTILYNGQSGYYCGDDIIRFIEPLVALPLNFWILYESGILSQPPGPDSPLLSVSIFFLGAALYGQGAGFHSAANMFKHPLRKYLDENPQMWEVRDLHMFYYWMRDTWEHYISHYVYAAGGLIMAAVHAYAYRKVYLPQGIENKIDRVLWLLASALYGIIIGAVAIQFPLGSIVAFTFLLVYGFGIVGVYLMRLGQWRSWGERFVLQYFCLAYIVGLLIVVAWIILVGGFLHNRKSAGFA